MAPARHRGQVLVVVNVASRCGFTPRYQGLQALYDRYRERGLVVLGFPCNQFPGQEPGDEAEIQSFCSTSYGVSFPMFSRIEVNGEGAHPLYQHLEAAAPGALGSRAIKWNFTKFLVDRQGQVTQRYAPSTEPEAMAKEIEALLAACHLAGCSAPGKEARPPALTGDSRYLVDDLVTSCILLDATSSVRTGTKRDIVLPFQLTNNI